MINLVLCTVNDRWLSIKLREHDECCRMTLTINAWMRNFLFVFYYLIVPIIDLAIMYLLFEKNILIRLMNIILIYVGAFNMFVVNYWLCSVGREAHKSYPFIRSILSRKRLGLMTKLKVISLAERLSGPLIGFYCYDLFPFTNYEFHLFCVNCVSNFTLFMGLFGI